MRDIRGSLVAYLQYVTRLVVLPSMRISKLVSVSATLAWRLVADLTNGRQLSACQGLRFAWLSTWSLCRSSIAWHSLDRNLGLPAAASGVVA